MFSIQAAEVEQRMRQERAEIDRQRAEYERTIFRLQTRCSELTAAAEKVTVS